MKKRLQLYANSIKISVCTKPTALLIFIVIILAVTIMMSLSFRWIFSGLEDDIYDDYITIFDRDKDNKYNYTEYKTLGKAIEGFYKSGLLGENANNDIDMAIFNFEMKTSDNRLITAERKNIAFVIRGYGFTKEEIHNGVNILSVSEKVILEHNLKYGEKVTLLETEFILREQTTKPYSNIYYVPYTLDIKDFAYLEQANANIKYTYLTYGNFNLSGAIRPMKIAERKILKKLGFKQHFGDTEVSLLYALGIFIPVLIASAVNILFINMYMQKVNRRKYALYKVIGMSPYMIAGLMFAESILLALIGCGIGILIDYIIYLFLPISHLNLQHMAWLNYLAIFVMTMIISIAVISVKIIKQAKAPPIDGKLLN